MHCILMIHRSTIGNVIEKNVGNFNTISKLLPILYYISINCLYLEIKFHKKIIGVLAMHVYKWAKQRSIIFNYMKLTDSSMLKVTTSNMINKIDIYV